MVREFDSFQIDVTNDAFETPSNETPLKKATIRFFDESKNILNELSLGYLDKKMFYSLLDKKTPLINNGISYRTQTHKTCFFYLS